MPISSGALEWPSSYYSKPPPAEGQQDPPDSGQGTPRGSVKGKDHEWQPKLADRGQYEKWRQTMDRKDPLKTRPRKRGRCCRCLAGNQRINTENEDPKKGEQRDSPREVMRRRRRCRCLLLALSLVLLCGLVMGLFLFLFLHFTGHQTLGPDLPSLCTGQNGIHYLMGKNPKPCCCIADLSQPAMVKEILTNPNITSKIYNDTTTCNNSSLSPSGVQNCLRYPRSWYIQLRLPYPPSAAVVPCPQTAVLLPLVVLSSSFYCLPMAWFTFGGTFG